MTLTTRLHLIDLFYHVRQKLIDKIEDNDLSSR